MGAQNERTPYIPARRSDRLCCERSDQLLNFHSIMADNDRVVYPDEVENVKAKAAEAVGGAGAAASAGDNNSVEEAPQEPTTNPTSNIAMRNMIQAPYNCPKGYEMDEKGVCREVF